MRPPRKPDSEPSTRETILQQAVPLFARAGHAGVSMRDVAAVVGISAAALYHHFPDKQALYLAMVAHAFAGVEKGILGALESDLPPLQRLQCFVERFTGLVADDADFRMLLQRELLDGDDERMGLLAQHIFRQPHAAIVALARELASDLDPYLLANSVVGLVLFSFQTAPMRRHLQGGCTSHDQPKAIAQHVMKLLTRVFVDRSSD